MSSNTAFRLRIGFAKQGRLAWISHLELVRALERCIRRCALPLQLSQGFNQHIKHSFGPALPVGTASVSEFCDVWLTDYIPASAALAKLQAVSASDLPILSCEYIVKDAPALQVSHCLAGYEIVLVSAQQLFSDLLAAQIANGELTVQKKGKPKIFDLSKIVADWHFEPSVGANQLATLSLTLRSSNDGSLRPEMLLAPVLNQLPEVRIKGITRVFLGEEE